MDRIGAGPNNQAFTFFAGMLDMVNELLIPVFQNYQVSTVIIALFIAGTIAILLRWLRGA